MSNENPNPGRQEEQGEQVRELLRKAIDDALNQAHYSFIHPETFPPMEHTAWREKWIKDNEKILRILPATTPSLKEQDVKDGHSYYDTINETIDTIRNTMAKIDTKEKAIQFLKDAGIYGMLEDKKINLYEK